MRYTEYVNRKWNIQRDSYRKTELQATTAKELRNAGSGLITNLISTVIVVVLAWELYRGRLGIGIFIALSKAIYDMIDLMYNELGCSIVKVTRALSFLKDMTEFANMEEAEGTNDLPAEKGPTAALDPVSESRLYEELGKNQQWENHRLYQPST